jgi:hypothetical protein
VLTAPKDGYYAIYHGWYAAKSSLDTKSPAERSEEAVTVGYNGTANTKWKNTIDTGNIDHSTEMKSNDPVSMKYKSTPHLVVSCSTPINGIGDNDNPTFILAELQRTIDPFKATNNPELNKYELQWIRCGDSVELTKDSNDDAEPAIVQYMQGDCYMQRYDCLKTYPFTNEDINSIAINNITEYSFYKCDFKSIKKLDILNHSNILMFENCILNNYEFIKEDFDNLEVLCISYPVHNDEVDLMKIESINLKELYLEKCIVSNF